ncbi:heparin lyase I family protein [Terrimonas sp. NA20]|uniref:Heparin lyase I family protein n=1 Tax=Terrimonas ginsenosidimutans TaxID=2908004 RepID=A0ABS9KRE4_9BACT|nr:heparin lyase I family protein [Terrimonas ginsenosidimutans]MCG2614915.1 heparin lyase I family protein [Terrimonas ginsenosidimutans]
MKNLINKLKSIRPDLYQHFSVGVIVFVLAYAVLGLISCPIVLRGIFSLVIVLAVAFEKEQRDSSGPTGFNTLDLIATLAGGIVPFLLKVFLLLILLLPGPAFSQRKHLLFEQTFETGLFAGADSIIECGNFITMSDSVKRYGSKSAKFSLNANDSSSCNDLRTMLVIKKSDKQNFDAWYAFSVYFTNAYPKYYDGVESFFQIYRDTLGVLPPLSIDWHGQGNYLTIIQNLVSPDSTVARSPYTMYIYPLDTVKLNTWVDVVINARWRNDSSGYVRVWVDKELCFINSGPNNYTPNYVRMGIDKEDWRRNWKISNTFSRELFLDEIRIGDSLAVMLDVIPGGGGSTLPITDRPERPTEREAIPFYVANPVKNSVIDFRVSVTRPQNLSYEVIDIHGRVLLRGSVAAIAGANVHQINIANLAKGMYFFALQGNAGLTVKKIIKQ